MQVYMGGTAPTYLASLKKSTCLAIYLAGCDFKCPYCDKHEFLDFKADYLLDILEAKRQINSQINNSDTVIFTGGEPTLQRQALLNLSRHCKDAGLKVGISTNGSKPKSLAMILRENILSFAEMDLKSPLEGERFEKITRSSSFFNPTESIISEIKESLSILKKNEKNIEIYFKTVVAPGLNDSPEDLIKIGNLIKDIRCTWILERANTEKTLDKNFPKKTYSLEELGMIRERLSGEFGKMNIEVC